GQDSVHVGREVARGLVVRGVTEELDEELLSEVLGGVVVSEHAPAVAVRRRLVTRDDLGKRLDVPLARADQEFVVSPSVLPPRGRGKAQVGGRRHGLYGNADLRGWKRPDAPPSGGFAEARAASRTIRPHRGFRPFVRCLPGRTASGTSQRVALIGGRKT